MKKKSSSGLVIWITGLSGSGKSTIGKLVCDRFKRGGRAAVLLDGDAVREVLGGDLGHDRDDRLRNAFRISRLAAMLSNQGITVVCATMSLFKECHDWNRKNLPAYLEVYLRVPLDELKRRDPKGLYQRAAAGQASGVVGMDLEYDEPVSPHLLIDNTPPATTIAAVERILRAARPLLVGA